MLQINTDSVASLNGIVTQMKLLNIHIYIYGMYIAGGLGGKESDRKALESYVNNSGALPSYRY